MHSPSRETLKINTASTRTYLGLCPGPCSISQRCGTAVDLVFPVARDRLVVRHGLWNCRIVRQEGPSVIRILISGAVMVFEPFSSQNTTHTAWGDAV